MTDIGGGLYDWLLLLIVILVFHESWRWAGLFLGRGDRGQGYRPLP